VEQKYLDAEEDCHLLDDHKQRLYKQIIPWKPNTDLSVVGLQGKDTVGPAKLGSQGIDMGGVPVGIGEDIDRHRLSNLQ